MEKLDRSCCLVYIYPIVITGSGNFAFEQGQIANVRCLKALGANIETGDNNGITPMVWAVGKDKIESIKCLAELGIDVNAKVLNGLGVVFVAATEGHIASLQCLRDLGARLDVTAKLDGNTTVSLSEIAEMSGHANAAAWLRNNGG